MKNTLKTALFVAFFCLFSASLGAQVSVTPTGWIRPQFLDSNGSPVAAGCLFTYAATTTTPLATYTTSAGSTQNTNPIILDAGGYPPVNKGIWLSQNSYKFVLKSFGGTSCASGSTLWTVDNIPGAPATAVYTTVDANGVAKTQRRILNWVDGSGTTIACADNSFLLSTDCEVDLAAGTVTGTALTAGQLIIGNASSAVTVGNLSGEVTTAGSTATTIATGAVVTGRLADSAVTTVKLNDGAVTEAKITLADNTTNNVSSSAHGFAPKNDGNTAHFLNGNGAYSTPAYPIIHKANSSSICTTGASSYDVCTTTLTWDTAFADTTYFPVCSGVGNSNAATLNVSSFSSTQIIVQVQTQRAATGTFTSVNCIGYHL